MPDVVIIKTSKWRTGKLHPFTKKELDVNATREELCDILENVLEKTNHFFVAPDKGWAFRSSNSETKDRNNY